MAEGTKVRPVRCPKCNLLQDLPDCPVFQCSGCGAVLRAKKQASAIDGLSEKSDEERVREDFEKLENFSDSGRINLSDNSASDRESDGVEFESWRRERVLSEKSSSSFSSRNGNRDLLIDRNGVRGVETMVSRYGHMDVEKEAGYGGRYRNCSKAPAENWVVVNDHEMNFNRNELAKAYMEKEVGEIKHQSAITSGLRGSRQIPNGLSGEGDGSTAFQRIPRAVVKGVKFSTPPYPVEGPSTHHLGSSYGCGEPIRNQKNLDGHNRVECLEQDRAELMRKLEELNEKLSRSCDVADKPIESFPPGPYAGHETWFQEGFLGSKKVPNQCFAPDKYIRRPPYFNHGNESIPLMTRHGVDMQSFYAPSMDAPNEVPGCGDLFGPQMHRRASSQPTHHYFHQPSQGYFSGRYADVELDPIESYPYNTFFHHPACSCLHCYSKHWQVPPQIPPDVFCKRRFPYALNNSTFDHLAVPATFGPPGYNPRVSSPPLYFLEPHPHARTPSDLKSEVDGLGRGRTRRVELANGNGCRCRPIAGGAPFITCYNCFELLQLPKKVVLIEKNQWKVRCRSCSTVISFTVESKSLVVSIPTETKQIPLVVDGGSGEVVREGLLHSDEYADQGSMNSYSDDYDNSGHFKSTDTENVLSTKHQWLNLSENEKMQGLLSSSSSPSENEESSGVITQRDVSNSGELPLKANKTPPLPGSPLKDYFDYSSNNVVGRFGEGNRSQRSDQEVVQNNGTFRQDSVKDASVATEMEVSFNEYSNTGMSQDSGELSKEDQPMISKGHELFFAGLTKKSFRDFSRSDQTMEDDKINVLINGLPIQDHLVKKAEKKAGPIQPGQYWYDFRAGFWGVMGQPCRGIIPPFIEEFNYPMPKNCAGGNTGVFVNERELNQKDLDLLAGRGLPTARDKSYIIEISGRVLDEDSDEELQSLGKLAPTVERVKHGFGMRVPRVAV